MSERLVREEIRKYFKGLQPESVKHATVRMVREHVLGALKVPSLSAVPLSKDQFRFILQQELLDFENNHQKKTAARHVRKKDDHSGESSNEEDEENQDEDQDEDERLDNEHVKPRSGSARKKNVESSDDGNGEREEDNVESTEEGDGGDGERHPVAEEGRIRVAIQAFLSSIDKHEVAQVTFGMIRERLQSVLQLPSLDAIGLSKEKIKEIAVAEIASHSSLQPRQKTTKVGPKQKQTRKRAPTRSAESDQRQTCALGEIPSFDKACTKARPEDPVIRLLHKACFGTPGDRKTAKRKLRKFAGFSPATEGEDPKFFNLNLVVDSKKSSMERSKQVTVTVLRSACRMLGVSVVGSKSELIERLLEFLKQPHACGRKRAADRIATAEPPSKKKRPAAAAVENDESQADEDDVHGTVNEDERIIDSHSVEVDGDTDLADGGSPILSSSPTSS
eukprot:ANDGO_03693.mRNA.1 hypothetical protein